MIISVLVIDYDFIQHPANTTVVIHASFNLQCVPPNSYPANIKVQWFKDYNIIHSLGRHNIATDWTLTVSNAIESDAGSYFCSAQNQITKEARTSNKAFVIVFVPPSIGVGFLNISMVEGQEMLLNCTASGIPQPSVKIVIGGVEVSSTGIYRRPNAVVSDGGIYKCVASNDAGETSKSVHVDIVCKYIYIRDFVRFCKTSRVLSRYQGRSHTLCSSELYTSSHSYIGSIQSVT